MFDLFRSRQKAVRYLLGAMLMIVALSMVITLIPGYGTSNTTGTNDSVLAQIGKEKITQADIERAVNQWTSSGRIPPEMVNAFVPQAIDQMILERTAVYQFQEMGLAVNDDEVLTGMMSQFQQFFPNGQQTKEQRDQLEAALAQQGLSLQGAIDAMRYQLLLRKVQNLLMATVVVPANEVDRELAGQNEKVKVAYMAFPQSKFRAGVTATSDEIKSYYEANKARYSVPEKRAYQVLVMDQEKFEQQIQVSDAQLRAAYSTSMDNFRMPERVRVRHILIKTTGKPDSDKKSLEAKAQGILAQLKKGADFADLAKKNSEDATNAEKGGELGWVDRGQTVPEFEKVAFSLKPNELSGVVTTQYGYHIMQVEEKASARVLPFDQVKNDLANQLKKDGVSEKMQTTADQVHAALEKSPTSAEAIAKQYSVALVTVPKAAAGEPVPTLGVSPEIDNALTNLQKNGVSPVLVLPSNRMAVVVLNDRIPSKPAELGEVEAQVRDQVINDKANAAATARAKDAVAKLQGGADIKQLAKSMNLDVTESTEVGRADSIEGLGASMQIADIFTKNVGGIVGPVTVQGRDIVAKVLDKKSPDPAKMAAERALTVEQLKRKRAIQEQGLIMESIRRKLVADGTVKVFPDNIKRVTTSFQK